MLHKTTGIILHTTKYSETSLIAKIYTQHFGLQSYIISGVRGKKSKAKGILFQPLALVDMIVTHSEKGILQRITELNNIHPFITIPYDIIKTSIVLFLNEILFKSLKESHRDEDLFEFIKNSLLILDLKTDNCSNFHIYFIVKLTQYLGFYPEGNYGNQKSLFDLQEGKFISHLPNHLHYADINISQLLYTFIESDYKTANHIRLNKPQRKQLLQSLILFYKLHLEGFGEIKSMEILEEVIS